MTKTIKKLEKEKLSWKTKFENGNRSLLQMVEEVGHASSDYITLHVDLRSCYGVHEVDRDFFKILVENN